MSGTAANQGEYCVGADGLADVARQWTGELSELLDVERQIAEALGRTAEEIAHVECFDDEQRAEVYTILQAIRADTEQHRGVLETLTDRLSGEVANA